MKSRKSGKVEIPLRDLGTRSSEQVWSRNKKSRRLSKLFAKMSTMRSRRPRRMEKLVWRNFSTTCITPIFRVPSEEFLLGIFTSTRTHKSQLTSKYQSIID